MATLTSFLPYDTLSFPNFFAWAKGIENAFSAFGWVPSSSGAELPMMNNNTNQGTATITNIAITSNVVTVTASHPFTTHQPVTLSGLTTATYLNGRTFLIASVSTNVSFTFSQEIVNNVIVAFSHADVGSAGDTGTATGSTNWSTALNKPDDTTTPTLIQHRYRGPYVSTTPAFTTLQVTGNTTIITCPGHGLAQGGTASPCVGQGFNITTNGGVLSNASFTFLATNPTGSAGISYAGWPILSVTATTIIINTASSPRADVAASSTNVGGIGSPMFMITGAAASGTFDVCTYNGDFYEAATTTSFNVPGTLVAPGTDTTKFKRTWYSIWKSADALSSTCPMYVKFRYNSNSNAPCLQFSGGQGTDGAGNLTANAWGSVTPVFISIVTSTVNLSSNTLWECDFAGGSGRFAALMWRGYSLSTPTPTPLLVVERSHDNNGNDTDAYWTMLFCFNSTIQGQVSVFKPGTGGSGVLEQGVTNSIKTLMVTNGQAINNGLPALPVFPLVGYVGNPLMNVFSGKAADWTEGAIVNLTSYGVTHPYLVSKSGASASGGPANFGLGAANAFLMRWD